MLTTSFQNYKTDHHDEHITYCLLTYKYITKIIAYNINNHNFQMGFQF